MKSHQLIIPALFAALFSAHAYDEQEPNSNVSIPNNAMGHTTIRGSLDPYDPGTTDRDVFLIWHRNTYPVNVDVSINITGTPTAADTRFGATLAIDHFMTTNSQIGSAHFNLGKHPLSGTGEQPEVGGKFYLVIEPHSTSNGEDYEVTVTVRSVDKGGPQIRVKHRGKVLRPGVRNIRVRYYDDSFMKKVRFKSSGTRFSTDYSRSKNSKWRRIIHLKHRLKRRKPVERITLQGFDSAGNKRVKTLKYRRLNR